MPEDIIGIIHRLSYDVQDLPIANATLKIAKQIDEVERLEKEVKSLSAEFAKTANTEVAKREETIKKINENQRAVRALNKDIQEQVINNNELHKVLEQEKGIVGSLTAQINLLKKSHDAATDPKALKNYNRQIASLEGRFGCQLKTQGSMGGNAAPSLMAASNIVRDAPFGIVGIGNNITQLSDNFAVLNQQTGSTRALLKLMAQSLIGPAGIAFGISVVTTLLTTLVMKYGNLGNAIEEIFGTLSEAEKWQRDYNKVLEDGAKSASKEGVAQLEA